MEEIKRYFVNLGFGSTKNVKFVQKRNQNFLKTFLNYKMLSHLKILSNNPLISQISSQCTEFSNGQKPFLLTVGLSETKSPYMVFQLIHLLKVSSLNGSPSSIFCHISVEETRSYIISTILDLADYSRLPIKWNSSNRQKNRRNTTFAGHYQSSWVPVN